MWFEYRIYLNPWDKSLKLLSAVLKQLVTSLWNVWGTLANWIKNSKPPQPLWSYKRRSLFLYSAHRTFISLVYHLLSLYHGKRIWSAENETAIVKTSANFIAELGLHNGMSPYKIYMRVILCNIDNGTVWYIRDSMRVSEFVFGILGKVFVIQLQITIIGPFRP